MSLRTVFALAATLFTLICDPARPEAQGVSVPAPWMQLTPLQRAEQLIGFACLPGLINQLVEERVEITKTYAERRTKYARYENQRAWVDFAGEWRAQTLRPGWFTVRRAGIKDLRSFPDFAFLAGQSRTFVRSFFKDAALAHTIRSDERSDAMLGEVAEIRFGYEGDRLKSLSFDCSI